jgi:hypothetical protein
MHNLSRLQRNTVGLFLLSLVFISITSDITSDIYKYMYNNQSQVSTVQVQSIITSVYLDGGR